MTIDEELLRNIIDLIKQASVGIVVALFTVWLSLRRFTTDKWWARKAEAYSIIMQSMLGLLDYYHKGSGISSDQPVTKNDKLIADQFSKAIDNVKRARDLGSFLISEKAVKCLAEMLEKEVRIKRYLD